MPTRAALIGITTTNSWQAGSAEEPVRLAYIATNSTQRIAFVSLQSTKSLEKVVSVATRASFLQDMPYGLVIELYLTEDLVTGETVYVSLAQQGATSYYPPQPIDDAK